ncbi:MAG: insulinase family protein [Eubacteriales bacterium]|nr:insulinase family protein [Eubacteriales bacterium]
MTEAKYRKIEERFIKEAGGLCTLYEHVRTGARVFTIKSEDPNKVFYIAFRTTPKDSTGVAHIMEHSVLCGSEKYPLKDPFIELAKGSLNTFLNAMTYPDKTVYPVASCNLKDFKNLCGVYMDAVLRPNIYKEKKIFEQEGWHYEVSEDGSLKINGVVYNEMKGVYSNPDSVLERYTLNSLFPDTTYSYESGGDPDNIPELTYEGFLDFHRTYYHPSNSYIYFYGDLDMEERLEWLDEEYLSKYEKDDTNTIVTGQKAPEGEIYAEKPYAILDSEDEKDKVYLSANFACDEDPDSLKDLAYEVLEFILLSAPGAPLREALIEAGIGEEVYGGYSAGIKQPYFTVVSKNTEKEKLYAFKTVIKDVISSIVDEGIPMGSLRAALNFLEFKYREEDFGRTPAGLAFGLNALESWIYERTPFDFLTYEKEFEQLNELKDKGYFEGILKELFLDNTFTSTVVIYPEKGLTAKKEEALAESLRAVKESLSEEEITEISEHEKELKHYQEEADDEELKKCLPHLELKDIEKKADTVHTSLNDGVVYTDLPSHGIAYARLLYDLSDFTEEELQYASFMTSLYGEMDTEKRSYRELSDEMLLETGGIDFALTSYGLGGRNSDGTRFTPKMLCEIRTFNRSIGKGVELSQEMANETLLTDEKRIVDKLLEAKSRLQAKIEGAGHTSAIIRSGSYTDAVDRFLDLTGGISMLDFLSAAVKFSKEPVHRKRFIKELVKVKAKLSNAPKTAALTGDLEALGLLREALKANGIESVEPRVENKNVHPVSALNEGITTGSQVNYVARTGCYLKDGEKPSGVSDVVKVFLSYDYLWTNVRVKGGAYGCMTGYNMSGKGFFVSYRDPNLDDTMKVYEELPEFLESVELSEDEVLTYIIGAIASMDQPVTVAVKAGRELGYFIYGMTDEMLQKTRDEVLSCTCEDIRAFAGKVRRILETGSLCVIGNETQIKKSDIFKSVRGLSV